MENIKMLDTPRALFVDDEGMVLNSLRRGLRQQCRDWELKLCTSPQEALSLLADFDPWVVISDKRMPEMNGIDFLRTVSQKSPEAIRVLLTGDTSMEGALEMTDVAHVLIAKPFELKAFVRILQRVKCIRTLPISKTLRHQLGAIEHIPVEPKLYQQLLECLKNNSSDTREMAGIINQSPYILAKLLQLANSAFLGFARPVSTTHEAIVRIGIELTKKLVFCFGVFEQSGINDNHVRDQLSSEAMDVALLCRELSVSSGCDSREIDDSFLVGLLHNIGKLILTTTNIQSNSDGSDIFPLIEDVAGAYMLAIWEYDRAFVNAILYQSIPEKAEQKTSLCCRLYVAKIVHHARKLKISALDDESGLNFPLLQSQGLLHEVVSWITHVEK
jgi:HD-like signal output (HDOD) protein/CheY-like chemotaxis protein